MQRILFAVIILPALATVLGAGGRPPAPDHRALGFERLDRNADGYLTREEIRDFVSGPLLERADTNRDGRIDRSELDRFMQGLPHRRG